MMKALIAFFISVSGVFASDSTLIKDLVGTSSQYNIQLVVESQGNFKSSLNLYECYNYYRDEDDSGKMKNIDALTRRQCRNQEAGGNVFSLGEVGPRTIPVKYRDLYLSVIPNTDLNPHESYFDELPTLEVGEVLEVSSIEKISEGNNKGQFVLKLKGKNWALMIYNSSVYDAKTQGRVYRTLKDLKEALANTFEVEWIK